MFTFTFACILASIVCAVGMVVLGGNMEVAQIQDVLSNFGASLMIVAGIVMGGYYALTEYLTEEIMQALAFLKEIKLSEVQFGFVFAAVAVVILLISLAISVKVLKNKEY